MKLKIYLRFLFGFALRRTIFLYKNGNTVLISRKFEMCLSLTHINSVKLYVCKSKNHCANRKTTRSLKNWS